MPKCDDVNMNIVRGSDSGLGYNRCCPSLIAGPTGPMGVPGPTGPTGPTGETGASELNPTPESLEPQGFQDFSI